MTEAVEHPDTAPYTVDADTDVTTVRMTEVREGWEQWFLLISDVHWDNPHCDRKLFHKLMKQAQEKRAGTFCFGDFFCAMQAKNDKRGSKASVRPEHQGDNYFDLLVDTAVDDIEQYSDVIEFFGDGNHETSIKKHHEIDLVERLCKALNVPHGGYSGFIRFMFSRGTSGKTSRTLFFTHGSGGGGPVTKGVIQTNRRAVWLPDPELLVSGHIHESWLLEIPRQRLSAAGKTYFDTQYHIQLPTFKQEHNLSGGWHIERGAPPKPLGGWWLRWYYDSDRWGNVGLDIVRAD